jgi:hypothetical protein
VKIKTCLLNTKHLEFCAKRFLRKPFKASVNSCGRTVWRRVAVAISTMYLSVETHAAHRPSAYKISRTASSLTLSAWRPFKIRNPPCLVILQPYGNRGVLVLRQEGWHERLLGTGTKLSLKVLILRRYIYTSEQVQISNPNKINWNWMRTII